MKRNFQSPKSNMMLNLNLISLVFLTSQSVWSGSLFGNVTFFVLFLTHFLPEFTAFVNRHPSCIQWLAALGLCSAFGQYFIFSIVTTFGPLWCSIVTTTRKFFTIIISVLLLGNALTEQQWTGACLVFVGLSIDAYFSSRPKQVASNAERKKTQ